MDERRCGGCVCVCVCVCVCLDLDCGWWVDFIILKSGVKRRAEALMVCVCACVYLCLCVCLDEMVEL